MNAIQRRMKPGGSGGGSVGSVLGTIGGAVVGSLVPGVGTIAGAGLGGAVGGATGQIVKPGQAATQSPGPSVMERRQQSQVAANDHSKILEDSLEALREVPQDVRDSAGPTLVDAFMMSKRKGGYVA